MTIYYLMIKTHSITGLKYLCQTKKTDPFKYLGSGKYWRNHLKKHGKTISTKILKECQTKEEVRELGIYYSDLWNVVESDEWANLMKESGNGRAPGSKWTFTEDHCKHISAARKGCVLSEDHCKNISKARKVEVEVGTHHFLRRSDGTSIAHDMNIARVNNGTHPFTKRIDGNSIGSETNLKNVSAGTHNLLCHGKPSNHTQYDHTIYTFIHTSGKTETCTRNELEQKYQLHQGNFSGVMRGVRNQTGGWKPLL